MPENKMPDTDAGLKKSDAAKQNAVENKSAEQPDYLALLKDKDERIAKLSEDRDNYRVGMLKYKKLADQDPEDKSLDDERIKQLIKEEMLDSQISQELAEKDLIIQKMAAENKELKTAIQNKSQVPNLPGGASQPEEEVKVEKLTDEQKAYFEQVSKEIGVKIDPNKFLENWNKLNKK